jgi:hypothetical protein
MDHKDHGVSAFANSVDRLLGSLIFRMAIMLRNRAIGCEGRTTKK